MSTVFNLPSAWLPIADAIVKATIVLLLAAGASLVLRRASAALRHLVWTLALCSAYGLERMPSGTRYDVPNPAVGSYRTKDGRFLSVVLLQSDRFWPDFVARLGHEGPVIPATMWSDRLWGK